VTESVQGKELNTSESHQGKDLMTEKFPGKIIDTLVTLGKKSMTELLWRNSW
jgi:hypothetical protein